MLMWKCRRRPHRQKTPMGPLSGWRGALAGSIVHKEFMLFMTTRATLEHCSPSNTDGPKPGKQHLAIILRSSVVPFYGDPGCFSHGFSNR